MSARNNVSFRGVCFDFCVYKIFYSEYHRLWLHFNILHVYFFDEKAHSWLSECFVCVCVILHSSNDKSIQFPDHFNNKFAVSVSHFQSRHWQWYARSMVLPCFSFYNQYAQAHVVIHLPEVHMTNALLFPFFVVHLSFNNNWIIKVNEIKFISGRVCVFN